jgi:hypothetical protein
MKIKIALIIAYFLIILLGIIELLNYRGIIGEYLLFDLRLLIAILLASITFVSFFPKKNLNSGWWLIKFNNHYFLPITLTLVIILFGIDAFTHPTFVTKNFGLNQAILLDLLIFSYFLKILTTGWKIIKKNWAKLFFFSFLLLCFYIYIYNSEVFIKISANFGGTDDDNFMEWLQVVVLGIGLIFSVLLATIKNTKKRQINPFLRIIFVCLIFIFIFLIGEEISWGQRLLNMRVKTNNSYQNELNIHNMKEINEFFILLYIFAFVYGFTSWRIGQYLKKSKPTQNQQQIAWRNLFCFRGQEVLYLLPTFIFNPYADRSLFSDRGTSLIDLYHNLGILPDFFTTLRFLVIWRESFEVLFYLALVIHVFNLYLNYQKKQKNTKENWINLIIHTFN